MTWLATSARAATVDKCLSGAALCVNVTVVLDQNGSGRAYTVDGNGVQVAGIDCTLALGVKSGDCYEGIIWEPGNTYSLSIRYDAAANSRVCPPAPLIGSCGSTATRNLSWTSPGDYPVHGADFYLLGGNPSVSLLTGTPQPTPAPTATSQGNKPVPSTPAPVLNTSGPTEIAVPITRATPTPVPTVTTAPENTSLAQVTRPSDGPVTLGSSPTSAGGSQLTTLPAIAVVGALAGFGVAIGVGRLKRLRKG